MIDPEKIDDPQTHVIRLRRETHLNGIPLQIGTPLAEIQLAEKISAQDFAEAVAAGDAGLEDIPL